MRGVDIATRRRHYNTETSPSLVFGTDLAILHQFPNNVWLVCVESPAKTVSWIGIPNALTSASRLRGFHEDVMDHNQERETNKESECLIGHVLEGDREALDKLLASYRRRLYRTALQIVGNPEDAEDSVQDAFLSAVRHLNQFEGRSKFSTWLTRVVINAAAMVRRSKHTHREASLEDWLSNDEGQAPLEIADLQPDPERVCSSSEIRALVNGQFNLLSPGLRSAFQLRHLDGLSCVETVQSLGISVSAVKSRVSRARRQLAESLNHTYRGARPDSPRSRRVGGVHTGGHERGDSDPGRIDENPPLASGGVGGRPARASSRPAEASDLQAHPRKHTRPRGQHPLGHHASDAGAARLPERLRVFLERAPPRRTASGSAFTPWSPDLWFWSYAVVLEDWQTRRHQRLHARHVRAADPVHPARLVV